MFDLRIELKKVALKVQEILEIIRDIKEALYDSGWIKTEGTLGSVVRYRKKNGWVYIHIASTTSNVTAKVWTTVFTLPEGFRPADLGSESIRIGFDSAGGTHFGTVAVYANGEIKLYQTSTTRYFNILGSFPVGGGYFLTLLRRFLRGGVCCA